MNNSPTHPTRETWRHWFTLPSMLGVLVCCTIGLGVAAWVGVLIPHPLGSVIYGSMACLYLGVPALILGVESWVCWLRLRKHLFRRVSMAACMGLAAAACFSLSLPMACRHFMRKAIVHDRVAGEQAHRQLLAELKIGTLKPDIGHDNAATDPVLTLGQWEGYTRLPTSSFQGRMRGSGAIIGNIGFTMEKPLQGELAVMMRRGLIWDIYDGRTWTTIATGQCEVTGWYKCFDFPSE